MRTKGLSPLIFHGVSNSSASVNASFAFTSGIAYVAAGIRLEALTSMFYQSRTIGARPSVYFGAAESPRVTAAETTKKTKVSHADSIS
jgi:hypothetical protein